MNIDKYTDRAKGFLQSAQTLALREGHQQFSPEHLLKVLLDDNEGLASGLIDRAGGESRLALQAVEQALAKLPKVEGGNGALGVVGFCYGGGIANLLATRIPELKAAVPFYGAPPPLEAVPDIKAELLLHFAGNDDRVNAQWPAYEAALKAAAIRYHAFVYDGVEHGFNNDTTPRYSAEAAKLAWTRTLELFNRTLRA